MSDTRSVFTTRAYGTTSADAPVTAMEISRQGLGPEDVLVDIHYCGICHSDIHQARGEWDDIPSLKTVWPCVPGHEITGRVAAVGDRVSRFKVGDPCGVGCMLNSCGHCEWCKADLEQHCTAGALFSYNVPDPMLGGHTFGGWSESIVAKEHFVISLSAEADLAATAPLLCAGLTTLSPMQRFNAEAGQQVGIVGLGGLGHVAVQLATARGAVVTVFTTSSQKVVEAKRLGAADAVVSTDRRAMEALKGTFDLILCTIPESYSVAPYIALLKTGATMVNIGAMQDLQHVNGTDLIFARKTLAGSLIGGIAETQQVVDFCAERGIKPEVTIISPAEIDEAMKRVMDKTVRYRFVIDMKAGRK